MVIINAFELDVCFMYLMLFWTNKGKAVNGQINYNILQRKNVH